MDVVLRVTRIATWSVGDIGSHVADWLTDFQPDIACIQDLRTHPNDLPFGLRHVRGYRAIWSERVAIYTHTQPQRVQIGLGIPRFDCEGRALVCHYDEFSLINVHVPSGTNGRSDWFYKMAFLYHLLEYVLQLREEGQPVVICGDFFIAHHEIDLARPIRVAGFMAEERDWISELLEHGFVDAFRHLHPDQSGALYMVVKSGRHARGECRLACGLYFYQYRTRHFSC